jgi:peptidoglycan hydrolase CwlO-like protein
MADELSLGSGISFILGAVILIMSGVFVAEFIGNRLIISGLVGEKKLAEMEQGEIQTEETQLRNLKSTLDKIEKKLDHLEGDIEHK